MAVKIGHASGDEYGASGWNGKAVAGDQTAKEVCTRNWYNKPWTAVFRAKDSQVAEKIAKTMEQACANNKIGYDQSQRTTLYAKAKAVNWDLSKITAACECDCSSLVAVCVNAAGIAVSKDMYTGNEKNALMNTGAFTIFTEAKYIGGSDYLVRGDILLGNGHTAVVLSNGEKNETTKKGDFTMEMRNLKKGCKGEDVKALQILLIGRGYSCGTAGADGDFGNGTDKAVKAYQKAKGLTADGIAGKNTMGSLHGLK